MRNIDIFPYAMLLLLMGGMTSCAEIFGTIGYGIGALLEIFLVIIGIAIGICIVLGIIKWFIDLFK